MWIHYGRGGWVKIVDDELPGPAYLQLKPDERGRWTTRELYVEGEWRGIVAGDLRAFPLSAIEASIDFEKLASNYNTAGPNLSLLASFFSTGFGSQARHWVADSFRAQIAGTDPKRPKPPVTAAPQRPPKLRRPDGPITDDFLRHVAACYAFAVRTGTSPAKAMSEQSGAPVKTAQRWIYLARQRGIMQPGRPGRVT